MAHRLNVQRNLHQALHGYSHGHYQLALSTTLKSRDELTLLALSDISGPGTPIREEGYLTGYPLAESGYFALARTWPAPEISRPGCVWTHTLLIDFTDLAEIEILTDLLTLFRRPRGVSAAQEYAIPIVLVTESPAQVSTLHKHWARQVLAGLYGAPNRQVVVGHIGDQVDVAVLSLWSQQWPRLRRRFRFCTFTVSDRSADSAIFDLQVVPSAEHSARRRFSDVYDADTAPDSHAPWLDDAIQDLLRPGKFHLRDFLRLHGADMIAGREAFRPLCELHRIMATFRDNPVVLHDAIVVLQDTLGAQQARTAWNTVVKAAIEQVEDLDQSSFGFLWNNLHMIEMETLINGAELLGRLAWERDPSMLLLLLGDEVPGKVVLERTLAALDASDLVAGISQAPGLRAKALASRPEIVGEPGLWVGLGGSVDDVLGVAQRGHKEAATAAVMLAGRDDLASQTVTAFGSILVLHVLCLTWDRVGDGAVNWIRSSTRDRSAVAEFLATEGIVPMPMLCSLAHALPPDSIPSYSGNDPWVIAAGRYSEGMFDGADSYYMAAYFLSRSLGEQTRYPGELAQLSFESVHAAAECNRLVEEGWRLLKPRLPRVAPWLEWDRCRQIRMGIADLFVSRELAARLFVGLCNDDHLFSLLLYRAKEEETRT